MILPLRDGFLVLLVLATIRGTYPTTRPSSQQPDGYRCELYCSDATYAQSGDCPNCGIPLRSLSAIHEKLQLGKTAAILVFPGVQVIDFAGPHEVLGAAGFRVVTVALHSKILRTDEGLSIHPDFTFDTCPEFQVLVLPGGKIYPDEITIRWIRDNAADAEYVLSVCNGLAWLESAGLVDGTMPVTTTATALPSLTDTDHYRRDRRVVAVDRIITSGGYTSGIDGALAIVAKYRGEGAATLLGYKLEHEWRPETSMYTDRRSYYEVVRPLVRALDRGIAALDSTKVTFARCDAEEAEVVWQGTAETAAAAADQLDRLPEWSRSDPREPRWRQARGDWLAELEATDGDLVLRVESVRKN